VEKDMYMTDDMKHEFDYEKCVMQLHSSSCGICFITNSYKSSRLRDPVYSATFSPSLYRNNVGKPSTCKLQVIRVTSIGHQSHSGNTEGAKREGKKKKVQPWACHFFL
jgi:hypothetical protein